MPQLDKMVQFGSVLSISDASGTAPPSATLDTTHDPLLAISGRVELLGMTDSIDVGVGSAGIKFHLEKAVDVVELAVDCTVHSAADFQAGGSAKFNGLEARLGPSTS